MQGHSIGRSGPIGFILALTLLGFLKTPAGSHDVIIKPERFYASAGQPLPIRPSISRIRGHLYGGVHDG